MYIQRIQPSRPVAQQSLWERPAQRSIWERTAQMASPYTQSLPSTASVSSYRPISISSDIELAKKSSTEWKPRKQEYMVMLTIAIISLMVALDATILVPVLPALASDLHGSATDAFWAGTSYLLTSAVVQPFVSSLSDIFGRQELLLFSLLSFTVGSFVCGIAHDFTALLAGRTVQGIGGGGIITMGQVIFADIVPLRQRPKWFSIVLAAWALGSVLGPLIGGLFVEYLNWRWTFYINFPFCAIGTPMVFFFVKLKTRKTSLKEKLLRVDWVGGFLFVSSMTSFLIGLSWAGVQFAWTSFRTLVPLIAGILGVILSIVWERYGAREPFLRRSLFHNASAIAAYICALVQGLLLYCSLYYAPFYFMSVHFASAIKSGINLLPVTCFLLPASAIVSLLITRLGRFRPAIWLGWVVTTIGCGLVILLRDRKDTPTAIWVTAFVIFGLGNGIILSSINFGIQAIAHTEDCAHAASMYAFMRTLGMTIGVAFGGTVFQNLMKAKLSSLSLPLTIAENAEGFVAVLKTLAESDPVRLGALQAYVHGFRGVFGVITGISGVGLVASLFIKSHSMDKILESDYSLE